MQLTQEQDFPRGGRKSNPNTANERPKLQTKRQENLFGLKRTKDSNKRKSKRRRAEARKNEEEAEMVVPNVEPQVLTHKTIKTDMIILGNVRSVSILAAEIELPGRIYGYVNIGAVSDVLTEQLQQQINDGSADNEQELLLRNCFEVGQYLPVKVTEIENIVKGVKVDLTTKPSVINADLSYTTFKKEMLIWATVAEKLEHGYRLDVGVPNVRTFLPNEKVADGVSYMLGQNIWCVINTCSIAPSATTLKVSALMKHIKSSREHEEERSLHSILPGMQFDFFVTDITKNGLLGEFWGQHKVYVHDFYFQKPLQNIKDFREGQELQGRVLYVEPITKIVFATLRGLELVSKPELKIGQIISAKVLGRTSGGVCFQLNETEKGFVTFKRILNSLGTDTCEDLIELVNEKYPVGKTVKCRILDYNRLDAVHICAVEASVLKEKFFTLDDVTLGQLVLPVITEIKDAGLLVKFGHLKGFIDNLHLSNSQYSANIKSRFRVGQKLKARILCIRNGGIRLTIKPALVESNLCLTNTEQVEIGKQFPGVVVNRGKFGALIVFYGDLKGFVHSTHLLPEATADARDILFDGQVVNVIITGQNDKGLELSLVPIKQETEVQNKDEMANSKKNKELLKIGDEYSGTITSIQENGLLVNVSNINVQAFLPLHHLSVNYDLNHKLLQTYSVEERLNNLMCIGLSKMGPLLSLREAIAYSKQNLSVPQKLQVNDLVRGSFIAKNDRSIRVTVTIKSGNRAFQLAEDDTGLNAAALKHMSFAKHQGIVAKVTAAGGQIKLSSKLSDVFDYTVEASLQILEQYLSNMQKIYLHLAESEHPLTKLSLGQRVTGIVTNVQKGGDCLLVLNDNIRAVVQAKHFPEDIEQRISQDDEVEGVILWIDYVRQIIDVSLDPKITRNIHEIQDGIIDESFLCISKKSEIILVKDNFALCTSNCNKQLVFLPVKMHENDFTGILSKRYTTLIGRKLKVSLNKKSGGRIIGFVDALKAEYKNTIKEEIESLEQQKTDESEISSESESIRKKRKTTHDGLKQSALTDETEMAVKKQLEIKDEDVAVNSDAEINIGKKRKLEVSSNTQRQSKKMKKDEQKLNVSFPSMSDFFSLDTSNSKKDSSSSSDEDEPNNLEKVKKKKKLSVAERAELAKQEEERIRQIENELADPSKVPESAEQFDRLVLAHPNSSKIWAQYIAFHLSTAEVEKARAVVKRALETIELDQIQDKLNIWIAYLNLENMFGTKESFEKAFDEASKYNDPYNIYLETIRMFADVKKYEEMEAKMKKFRGKFKGLPKTWIEMARVYYEMQKFDEARKLKEGALKSITDKKQHIDMLVQFAIMEFKYGEQNQGEVLFETILSSYPGRVDVWNSYVDQLVKKGCIDSARRVLERATSQRLSLMKMRSVFKKFRDFEKAHGTEESLQQVKDALVEYIARTKNNIQS